MKKILVPTDASEYSRKALKMALEIARRNGSVIELFSVVEMPEVRSYADMARGDNDTWLEEIRQLGEQAIKATLEGIDTSGITMIKRSMKGKPANLILREIEKENIDLVIMGSHGYGAVMGAILGSVSQRVLQGAKCSVLIAK